jgi:hypothetical protein
MAKKQSPPTALWALPARHRSATDEYRMGITLSPTIRQRVVLLDKPCHLGNDDIHPEYLSFGTPLTTAGL